MSINQVAENTTRTIETKNGTLHYKVVIINDGLISASYAGEITHDLHKHPRFNGRKVTRYSKNYKTERGANNWVSGQYHNQLLSENAKIE